MTATELKIHPFADCLPKLSESENQELRDDIAKRGLREPILIKDGYIIDGRHRYHACCELGMSQPFESTKATIYLGKSRVEICFDAT